MQIGRDDASRLHAFFSQIAAQAFAKTDQKNVLAFFQQYTCRVEAVDAHQELQRVYFPKPVICDYITESSRDTVSQSLLVACC